MVFRKNIVNLNIRNIFSFILISLFICSCSSKNYSKIKSHLISLDDIKTIKLLASSYRVSSNEERNIQKDSEIYNFESKLRSSFIDWANKKFVLKGKINSAYLQIDQVEIFLKGTSKNKGIKKLLYFEEKKTYVVRVQINFNLNDEERNSNNLSIKGEIDFLVTDNTSINDRKRAFNKTIKKLILAVDKTLNENLKKKQFNKFFIENKR